MKDAQRKAMFANSKERKAYFAKNKDAGWHYKDSHGTHSTDTSALPNPHNKLLNKEFTKRDREQSINGDYFNGKNHKLVEYPHSPHSNHVVGIGKLKQYDNRHGQGQRRYSGGSYSGGSIWGKPFEEYGLNKGVRHEYIAHKKGLTKQQVIDNAMSKKTNNFKMFEVKH